MQSSPLALPLYSLHAQTTPCSIQASTSKYLHSTPPFVKLLLFVGQKLQTTAETYFSGYQNLSNFPPKRRLNCHRQSFYIKPHQTTCLGQNHNKRRRGLSTKSNHRLNPALYILQPRFSPKDHLSHASLSNATLLEGQH